MLRRHGEYALELGWERNNFYVWTKQKGALVHGPERRQG